MVKMVMVGAGIRADVYASYSLKEPDQMQIVGIVDPDEVRTELMRQKYSVPKENCFSSVAEFVAREKFADAVINGTMDQLHVETSIPILRAGYDMLLEKPFAVNEAEMQKLLDVVKETGRKVYICHVLRYTPFYSAIKKRVAAGEIGKIISIELNEHVSYYHTVAAYVRGKWRSVKDCFATMLLAKSCHDMDLMMWMLSETKPVSVASFGGDFQFGPDKKPEGAGSRCMTDCPYNDACIFSAKHYLNDNMLGWWDYVAKCLENHGEIAKLPKELVEQSLKTDNEYGKCVWDFDRGGNVDHQSVIVNFENGATGVFNMVGGTAHPERNIHIVGTKGEIKGGLEEQRFTIRTIDPESPALCREEVVDVNFVFEKNGEHSGHGGGDERIIADFVSVLHGGEKSISCTEIMDSARSHLAVFRADESRKIGKIIALL